MSHHHRLRDYLTDEDRSSPQIFPYGFRMDGHDRYFVFQTRDWQDDFYDVGMYFVREATGDEPARVTAGRSRYYAIGINVLMAMLADAGFSEIHRLNDVMHQPIIVGRRAVR